MKTNSKSDLIFDSGKYSYYFEFALLIFLVISAIAFLISGIIEKWSLKDIVLSVIGLLILLFMVYYSLMTARDYRYRLFADRIIVEYKNDIKTINLSDIADIRIGNLSMDIKYTKNGEAHEEKLEISKSELLRISHIKKGFRDFKNLFEKKRNKKTKVEYERIRNSYQIRQGLRGGWSSKVMTYEEGLKDLRKRSKGFIPIGIIFSVLGITSIVGMFFIDSLLIDIVLIICVATLLLLFLFLIIYFQVKLRNPQTTRAVYIGFRKINRDRMLKDNYEMMKGYGKYFKTGNIKDGYPMEYILESGIKIRIEFVSTSFEPNGRLAILYKLDDYEEAASFQQYADHFLTKKKIVRNTYSPFE